MAARRLVVEKSELHVAGILGLSYEPTHLLLGRRLQEFGALKGVGRFVLHGFWERFRFIERFKLINPLTVKYHFAKCSRERQAQIELYMPDLRPLHKIELDDGHMHVVHEILRHAPHITWLKWPDYFSFTLELFVRYEIQNLMIYVCNTLQSLGLVEAVREVGKGWHEVRVSDFLKVVDDYEASRGAVLYFRVVPDDGRNFLSNARFGVTENGNPADFRKSRVIRSINLQEDPKAEIINVLGTEKMLVWFVD